jgi:hypothetical protein
MTARDLINRSLRLIGGLAAGETASAHEETDAFDTLTELLDAWTAMRLTIHEVCREVFALAADTATYTLGVGGTWDHSRPLWIEQAGILTTTTDGSVLELPLEILTTQRYAEAPVKADSSTLPTQIYFDMGFPWITVTLLPTPSVSGLEVALYLPSPQTLFADLSTDYDLPPAWAAALRFNLAVELAPEWGKQPDPLVIGKAQDYLGMLKRGNKRLSELAMDDALVFDQDAPFNYLTGV